jgi:hypothetical protein
MKAFRSLEPALFNILRTTERLGAQLKKVGSSEWAGPCPRCGGTDRFAVNTRKAVWHCRGCDRGGDTINLVRFVNGCSYGEALAFLGRAGVPNRGADARKADKDDHERLKLALDLFDKAHDAHGTPVEAYLASRKLDLPDGADTIRFHPHCAFGPGERVPCMIALFRHNLTDEPVGIQRTRVPPKRWVRGMKMERKNLGPTGRGSIKIDNDVDVLYGLAIAEGLETALAGRMLGYRPAWATGGKGTLKRFPVLPEPVQSLSIHWEPDAANDVWQCVKRWGAAGRETIRLDPLFGKDAADALWEGS